MIDTNVLTNAIAAFVAALLIFSFQKWPTRVVILLAVLKSTHTHTNEQIASNRLRANTKQ